MSTTRVTTVAVLVASLALTALPAGARAAGFGGDGQEGQAQPRAERRRPREGGAARQGGGERQGARQGGDRQRERQGAERQGGVRRRPDAAPPQTDRGDRGDRGNGDRGDQERQAAPRREAVPRNDAPRGDEGRDRGGDRDDSRRAAPPRYNRDLNRDGWRDNDRYRSAPRYVPSPRAYRGYSHPPRVYVVPYGYRPQGYRPGWSTNLYFGRPYRYGYPGAYGSGGYGYYALPPGFAYGSLRIVDAPRDAQVFVDGYYAGVVDDYDGVFQRLNLEPGAHHVEIDTYPGAPPLDYEVYVEPGRTVTIHARY